MTPPDSLTLMRPRHSSVNTSNDIRVQGVYIVNVLFHEIKIFDSVNCLHSLGI